MNREQTSAVALVAAAVLCLCLLQLPASAPDASGASAEVTGVSYESHSPSGMYGLQVEYFSDGTIGLRVVDGTTRAEKSESFHAVSVSVYELVGIDGDAHRGDHGMPVHLYPFSMGAHQIIDGRAILSPGYYHAIIRTGDGAEIVCSKFIVGSVIDVEVSASQGGAVSMDGTSSSSVEMTVPKGSTVSMDGDSISVMYGSRTIRTVEAMPPEGKVLDGWYRDGERLSEGDGLYSDASVVAVWKDPDHGGDGGDDSGGGTGGHGSVRGDIGVDSIRVPEGWSTVVPFTVSPAGTAVYWAVSDPSVATVEDGIVRAVSQGEVVISVVAGGSVLDTVTVTVGPPTQSATEKTIGSPDGGTVTLTYDSGGDGDERLIDPILIQPVGDVTAGQSSLARGYVSELAGAGIDPVVIVSTGRTEVSVPSDLLDAIRRDGGSLAVESGRVTLSFPSQVLEGIGCSDDLRFVVMPETAEVASADVSIDSSVLDADPDMYEVYLLRNGQRVILDGTQLPVPIGVSVEYTLPEGGTPDRIRVYCLDPDPDREVSDPVCGDGAVRFGVLGFGHYAIVYDAGSPDGPGGGWVGAFLGTVLILLVLLMLLLLLLPRRFEVVLTVEGGIVAYVPEGWERISDSSVSGRFRWRETLELPQLAVSPPEGMEGHVIVGWDPEPPGRVTGSIELRCVWSDDVPGRLAGPDDRDRWGGVSRRDTIVRIGIGLNPDDG